jgi:hypothetical protein
MRAIDSCRVFVRVFSENANDSEHVRREVAKAFSLGLAVIPFRTDAVSPNRSLGYFLETVHWLAITPPLQNHLGVLTEQVQQLLADDQESALGQKETLPADDPPLVPPALPKPRDNSIGGKPRPSKSRGWLLKLNLAFVPILLAGIGLAAVVIHNQLLNNAILLLGPRHHESS